MIPEQVYVLRYHVKKYACHECEGSGDEDKPAVRTGKVSANIIPGSIATPELLSYVFTKKYCDYVPFYRQEGAFERIGGELVAAEHGPLAAASVRKIAAIVKSDQRTLTERECRADGRDNDDGAGRAGAGEQPKKLYVAGPGLPVLLSFVC
jgi:transposase